MIALFIFTTIIPIATFSYAFPRMTARLRKTPAIAATAGVARNRHETSNSRLKPANSGVFERARRRMQRTLLLLFVSYALCILPCNVFSMLITLRLLAPHYYTSAVFHALASLYYANIIANPLIFGLQYQHYRRALHCAIHRYIVTSSHSLLHSSGRKTTTSSSPIKMMSIDNNGLGEVGLGGEALVG